jgi:phenylpropionate dioxygenase-like ring-hydroxylating dioxygenase large terminal subunit
MLSQAQNELLTRVERGTPMGDMLREYWVPACRSAKLVADGAPERVRLFGEKFVAFRATDGRVGFLAERCPHRCASLALARNEHNGLRCIFHGWKFSVDGKCVDAPTEPPERRASFAAKVPVQSYPVREGGGLVWVYLGTKKEAPRFPDFEFTRLAENQVYPMRGLIHTNWLQGLEALLDSAHVSFLHSSNLGSAEGRKLFGADSDYMLNNGAPTFEFIDQPYGFREGALRDQDDGLCYARIREVALPFFSFIPAAPGGGALACCSIPVDDEWTAQWYIMFNPHAPLYMPRMSSYGRNSGDQDYFNSDMGGPESMWHQDREAMRQGHWSGIVGRGNAYEDFVIQESMGPIVDRSMEFLATCDHVIIRARSMLLRAVERFKGTGEVSFVDKVEFGRIRAISIALPKGGDWRTIDAFDPPARHVA